MCISPKILPKHVAIIMDGNKRWARKRLLPVLYGHKAGIDAIKAVIEVCIKTGVKVLTLFAFSSENWQRPTHEVTSIMNLFLMVLKDEVLTLNKNNIRLLIIGDRTRLNSELQIAIRKAETITSGNTNFLLQIAVNYGGKWDILQAVQKLAKEVKGGYLLPEDISSEILKSFLVTRDKPFPDLCIRTGGEYRISNFFLWQLAYTELYFSDIYWPDFQHIEMQAALIEYSKRQRRFGKSS